MNFNIITLKVITRFIFCGFFFFTFFINPSSIARQKQSIVQKDSSYFSDIIKVLKEKWPKNRTINLVFHGHSVPSGYQQTPIVTTVNSYPFLVLKLITDKYPYAVVNTIKTSIGGENSEQGAERFEKDVLIHQPDVIFIDYALNDRKMGLERSKIAWEKMIEMTLQKGIKLVLLTPTPDLHEDIKNPDALLAQHTRQIIDFGKKYNVPVVDSYNAFKKLALEGFDLKEYMAQNNHINPKGHQIVAQLIMQLF